MRKLTFILKWSIIIFLSIILLVEITLRITCEKKLSRYSAIHYIPDSLVGYRYKPDTVFLNSNIAFSHKCKSNKFGFPGENFERIKEPDKYRIIIVGTSDDTGFNTDGECYVKILNDMFQENGYNVEVVNCAIDGRDRIVRNMHLIQNEIVNYQPDMILLRNQFPLSDIIRYRETYRDNIIYTAYLSHIPLTKQYIDNVYKEKNSIFKFYNVSYIFRYYCKVYLDYKTEKPEHRFVRFSENVFTYERLNKIRMYVRNEVKYNVEEKAFDISLVDMDSNWSEETVTWNNSPVLNKLITTFSSGDKSDVWITADITEYLKNKVSNNQSEVSFSMFISPSKMRRIMFASKESLTDSTEDFYPVLEVTMEKDEKDDKTSESHSLQAYLRPTDDAFIRGGVYSDSIQVDTIIQVKNGSNDHSYSRKGLIKFDISDISSVEKAILKLYVDSIEYGAQMAQDLQKYSIAQSIDSLQRLQSFLNEKKIKMVLFETYKNSSDTLKRFYYKNDLYYLPLNIKNLPDYTFGDIDGHSTQKGHKVIAEHFYNVITNKIFPELNRKGLCEN